MSGGRRSIHRIVDNLSHDDMVELFNKVESLEAEVHRLRSENMGLANRRSYYMRRASHWRREYMGLMQRFRALRGMNQVVRELRRRLAVANANLRSIRRHWNLVPR